jgi:hypothetical protein
LEVGDDPDCRPPNGILGLLLKEHFPGMVKLPGEDQVEGPAYTWYHYKAKKDHAGVTIADRVKEVFWVSFLYTLHLSIAS